MSSSEPRLSFGDGVPVFRAQPAPSDTDRHVVDVPTAQAPAPSAQPGPLSRGLIFPRDSSSMPSVGSTVKQRSPKPLSSANDNGALPPLLSISELISEAPAWLLSAALHMLAIIILGLLFIVPEQRIELMLRLDDQDGFEELSGSEFDLDLEVEEPSMDASLEAQEIVALEDPVLVEPTEIQPLILDSQSIEIASPIRMALTGRSEGMQQKLLDAYGGTGATQRAVMNALRWLQRYQSSPGSWSLSGKYTDGSRIENREAATGLALLAFQGAGYTPNGDPQHDFTKVTAKAWKYLLKKQNEEGSFVQTGGRHNGQLYTQAICSIALCELYGMTQDSFYREPAQRAIDYALRIQASEGGWRYSPGRDSDLSVTGWFVMALQSARMAGLEVPTPALQRISGFLDSVSYAGGAGYGYHPQHAGATASMTAEGLLCRQYLGWTQEDNRLQRGANFLTENLPTWERGERDVYYWYYATQVCHHMEGRYWRTWNDKMKVILPENQVQEGRERGSWDSKGDEWGSQGGRLFVTCLSTFMLEVYYRHLPIYSADILSGTP